MEEIKKLYARLAEITDEDEREKLWHVIIEKNKVLLNAQKKRLKEILDHKVEDAKKLTDLLDAQTKLFHAAKKLAQKNATKKEQEE